MFTTETTEKTERPVYLSKHRLFIWGTTWNAYYISLFFPVIKDGKTSGNIEHIIYLESIHASKLRMVFFGSHSYGKGCWEKYEDCCFTSDGALRIFVSPRTNSMYPRARIYTRAACLANDVCSNTCVTFRPTKEDFEDPTTQSWSKEVKDIKALLCSTPPPYRGVYNWERTLICLPCVVQRLQNLPRGSFTYE